MNSEVQLKESKILISPNILRKSSKLKLWESASYPCRCISNGLACSLHSVLQYLIDNTWLDEYTRAIFVEFTVYNANLNLFCIVNVMLETSAVGKDSLPLSSGLGLVRYCTS